MRAAAMNIPQLGNPNASAVPRHEPACLAGALVDWRKLLGAERVLVAAESVEPRLRNTLDEARRVPAVLRPSNAAEVQEIVRIANRHRVPVYPVSTGRNWGNGCAAPVKDGCALLELAGLNKILEFDAALGLVTVEPGVTQGMLAEYLDARGLPFLVPTTGAGPNASLLGNAVERGYGLSPYGDHFAHVTALEAVLPDGSLYRSALSEAGGEGVDKAFKWGLGPYLDGIFTQSNLGIVTRMTFALAPRPERTEAFFISLRPDANLDAAVLAVQNVLRRMRGVTGAINLMNARRMLAMAEAYPAFRVPAGEAMPDELVDELAARNQITPWTVAGALYGAPSVVRAAKKEIKRAMAPLSKRWLFVTEARVRWVRRAIGMVPLLRNSRWSRLADRLAAGVCNMAGRPSDVALPLAYWKSGREIAAGENLNPSKDGDGLIWYTPLVPMKPAEVRAYVAMTERICLKHGMEPLVTLTSLSDRCFDSTVPLLFKRNDPREAARAKACFDELFETGRAHGWVPYRAGLQSMNRFARENAGGWQLGARIKDALDPNGILAPGRYVAEGARAAEGRA